MRRIFSGFITILLVLWGTCAFALEPPPNYGQWVVDNAKLFTKAERIEITRKLSAIERDTGGQGRGAQVAVLTMKSLEGDDIRDFAIRTARAWKLGAKGAGSKGKSNGVLILIVKDVARVRIEVGTGLEGALNDGKVGQIIGSHFGSRLNKTAANALKGTIDEIAAEIYREYKIQRPSGTDAAPKGEPAPHEVVRGNGDGRLILFGITVFMAGILGAVFHRRRRLLRYWFGGALGGSSWYLVAVFYTLTGLMLWAIAALGYVLGYYLAALFRHGGDGWLFDPFPRYYGVGVGGSDGRSLRGGGGDTAGGGADAGVDPGLFDGVGSTLSNAVPSGDCPDMGGCDAGGCDPGGC